MYTPPVTPRESAIPEVGAANPFIGEAVGEGRVGDWGEVVTR